VYNDAQINVEAIEYLHLFCILKIPFGGIFVSLLLKSILQVTDLAEDGPS